MAAPTESVDLTNCDREPIHLLGAIQPFGFLIVVATPDWFVQRVSANIADWLNVPPADMLGRSLLNFFSAEAIHTLRNQLHIVNMTGSTAARVFGVTIDASPRRFDLAIHTLEGLVVIECEPSLAGTSVNASALVRGMMNRVQSMPDPVTLSHAAARELRALTGFDRVMVYRFAPDESGEVIAESTNAGIESFLGLHYPASDIPRQARTLYERNWLRIIPDIEAAPAPIQPTLDSAGKPLDLSQSVLRSVSPIHIEYLRNMGVCASMSVSILREGRLWGLFACHHNAPLRIGFERRTAAELFGQMFSLLMENREREAEMDYENRARELLNQLAREMVGNNNRVHSIAAHLGEIAEVLACNGAALSLDGEVTLHGMTPERQQFAGLIEHLRSLAVTGNYATNEIGAKYAPGVDFHEHAAGMLALPISRRPRDYLVFFRRAVARTVNWAGDPNKPVTPGPLGDRLTPRKSFQMWQETVTGQSVPWSAADLRIADSLRVTLVEVILRLSDQAAEERQRALQRQEVLINELNHRVRSILGLIRSLIAQSQDPSLTALQFMDLVSVRIKALARAHDLIAADQWGPALFSRLVEAEAAACLNGGTRRLQIVGPDARVQPKAFNLLALVIHELISNAAKYGALNDQRGRVTVETRLDDSNNFIIDWRERGGPPVRAPEHRGFGRAVIERTIPSGLQGEASLDFEEAGVHACFLIPADYVRRVDEAQSVSGDIGAQPTNSGANPFS